MGKVLVVDDENLIRETLALRLADQGYDCVEAADGEEALRFFQADSDIKISLVDIRMPRKSGLDLVAEFRSNLTREIEVIVMTGHGGVEEAVRALRLGACDFLQKPFSFDQAISAVKKCETRIREREEQEKIRRDLEESIELKTKRIEKLVRRVDSARIETLEALGVAAEQRDDDTGTHIRRIGEYAAILARKLGWSQIDAEMLRLVAMLHDVGKIGVPDAILLKPGVLTQEEFRIIQTHTTIGYEITRKSHDEVLQNAAEIALTHHERWDGGGYPQGLASEEIPIEGRIVALCDVYDALRSARPYKAPFNHAETVKIIVEGDDRTDPRHFDPDILLVFKNVATEFARIFEEFSEQSECREIGVSVPADLMRRGE